MALGAQRFNVLRFVLVQAGKLVLAGTAAGILLALLLAQALKSLIYHVSPADPLTFTAIGLAVVLIAILAGYIQHAKPPKPTPWPPCGRSDSPKCVEKREPSVVELSIIPSGSRVPHPETPSNASG